jgi:hypothetical protein
MASKRVLWNKIGRYFSALVIAAFFLPFFGVSCDGMEVITVSGADMVGGCKPGGMISEMEKEEGNQRKKRMDDPDMDGTRESKKGGMSGHVDNVEREPLAMVALALAIAGFAVAWLRSRKGLTISFGVAIATIGVLVGLWVKVGGDLREAVDKEALGKTNASSRMTKDVKIDAGGRYGLWLSGILLLSIAVITGRALREPDGPDLNPPLPPPTTPV